MVVLLHGGTACCWSYEFEAVQLCMGPGEETLVTGGYDQAVRVWDMRSRSFDAIQTMKLFADSVTTVAVSARCDAHSTQTCFSQMKPSGNMQCQPYQDTKRVCWNRSKPAGSPELDVSLAICTRLEGMLRFCLLCSGLWAQAGRQACRVPLE